MPGSDTEGKASAELIPPPALKLRPRALSSPAAPPAPRLVSLFRRGCAPNPTQTLRGDPSAPLRVRETRTCASWRVIEEATQKADASVPRHALGFRGQARDNARPAAAE